MTALNSTVICVSSVIWNKIGMILSCCSHHIFLQKMITCYLEPSFFTQNIPFSSFANKTWFYLKERQNSWWPIFESQIVRTLKVVKKSDAFVPCVPKILNKYKICFSIFQGIHFLPFTPQSDEKVVSTNQLLQKNI